MGNALVVSGKSYPVCVPVKLWTETGLEFRAGEGFNKRRRRDIDLAVWHWTGSENKPTVMARTLKRRKLGVEFAIDRDGTIWQFCDPVIVDTADAGRVNARSVGTEIVNYGFRRRGKPIPASGKKRTIYECTLNGRSRRFAHFLPQQIAAALVLADVLSTALPIPRAVPTDPTGDWLGVRVLPKELLDDFKGHLGHFHVSERKSDPGLDLLEAFWAAWTDEI